MHYEVVGIFGNYAAAESAIRDLETTGIGGGQVELIADLEDDIRTAHAEGEPSTQPREGFQERLARLFGSGREVKRRVVHADAGEQPDYIGDQEYYANHIKQGGAVLIVRTSTELQADEATGILRENGARTPGAKAAQP
jgi:hypothetical protein